MDHKHKATLPQVINASFLPVLGQAEAIEYYRATAI